MKKGYRNFTLLLLFVFILSVSMDVYAVSCDGVIRQEIIEVMNNYVYTPIKWLVPVALLVLTSFDFAGVVFNGKKDKMDKAKNNFLKRAVAGLIIFFAPDLINLIVKFVNDQSIASCLNQFK